MTYAELLEAYQRLCSEARSVKVTEEQFDELTEMGALAQYVQSEDESE